MVSKENVQSASNTSLLRTATTKRLGAGNLALQAMRMNPKPPMKKVELPKSSGATAVSELTGSIEEVPAPPMVVKEIKLEEAEIEKNILTKTVLAPSYGKAVATNPQPKAFLPSIKEMKASEKKEMVLQKGLKISTPSPMSLNRIEVQMGQEKSAPMSKEFQEQMEADKKRKEMQKIEEQNRIELEKATKELKELVQQEVEKEQEEGFEAQLEDFEVDDAGEDKEKALMKRVLRKFKPTTSEKDAKNLVWLANSEGKALNEDEARELARMAMAKAGMKVFNPDFPLSEILSQARDDESVSTLGTPRFEKREPVDAGCFQPGFLCGSGAVLGSNRAENDPDFDEMVEIDQVRLRHRYGNALMDQTDSVSNFDAVTNGTDIIVRKAGAGTLVAACADQHKKTLDTIGENDTCTDVTKKAGTGILAALAVGFFGTKQQPKQQKHEPEVIDLTCFGSPRNGAIDLTHDTNVFRFDALNDVAASRLSPKQVVLGHHVEANASTTDSLPVVRGIEVNGRSNSKDFEVYDDPDGDVVICYEENPDGNKNLEVKDKSTKCEDTEVGMMCAAFMNSVIEPIEQKRKDGSIGGSSSEDTSSSEGTSTLNTDSGTLSSESTTDRQKAKRATPTPERMLENNDGYWDTLSTIASTKDNEKAVPAVTTASNPGPIPNEIRTPSAKDRRKSSDSAGNIAGLIAQFETSDLFAASQAKTGDVVDQGVYADSDDEDKTERNTPKSANRNVSWGVEEIYEAPDAHEGDNNLSSPLAEMAKLASAAAASAESFLNGEQKSAAEQVADNEEQELISKTLALSKELLASMSVKDLEAADDAVVKSLELSLESREDAEGEKNIENIQPSICSKLVPDSVSNVIPLSATAQSRGDIINKLEGLWAEKAQTVPGASPPASTSSERRGRDRSKLYAGVARGDFDFPSPSSSTTTGKAAALRKQLDEALQASKQIRVSQEQLGNELRTFKDKFYKKNDELEDKAIKAISDNVAGASM